jgi:hypothetical protein
MAIESVGAKPLQLTRCGGLANKALLRHCMGRCYRCGRGENFPAAPPRLTPPYVGTGCRTTSISPVPTSGVATHGPVVPDRSRSWSGRGGRRCRITVSIPYLHCRPAIGGPASCPRRVGRPVRTAPKGSPDRPGVTCSLSRCWPARRPCRSSLRSAPARPPSAGMRRPAPRRSSPRPPRGRSSSYRCRRRRCRASRRRAPRPGSPRRFYGNPPTRPVPCHEAPGRGGPPSPSRLTRPGQLRRRPTRLRRHLSGCRPRRHPPRRAPARSRPRRVRRRSRPRRRPARNRPRPAPRRSRPRRVQRRPRRVRRRSRPRVRSRPSRPPWVAASAGAARRRVPGGRAERPGPGHPR